jgi:hypothetical protein
LDRTPKVDPKAISGNTRRNDDIWSDAAIDYLKKKIAAEPVEVPHLLI